MGALLISFIYPFFSLKSKTKTESQTLSSGATSFTGVGQDKQTLKIEWVQGHEEVQNGYFTNTQGTPHRF